MKIITDLEKYEKGKTGTAIALGAFDGVHIAHKAVISHTDIPGLVPAVFTFEHQKTDENKRLAPFLTVPQTKRRLIEELGVQLYFCPPFKAVKNMSGEDFVLMLKQKLGAKAVICGYNFRFGKGGTETTGDLKAICKANRVKFILQPPVFHDSFPVSSSLIREHMEKGKFDEIKQMLGYDFIVELPVVHGNNIGRKGLSIPTINQVLPRNFVRPRFGVYATETLIDGKKYRSISNVGNKPTIGSRDVSVETFIFDFDGDLYGSTPIVKLEKFIRDERKFGSLSELKAAIERDIEVVKGLEA